MIRTMHLAAGHSLVAAAMLVASPLDAQTEPADSVPDYHLAGITVTATRGAVDRGHVPRKIDVVTADDLGQSAVTSVAEALRETMPIDVIQYPGLLTGVSVRGFRPRISGTNPYTLILVDGRPAGTSNLALLGLGGVDRIEVVRGPASALYGSSAMGGVVNVITSRSTGPLHGEANAAWDTFGGYQTGITAGGATLGGFDFDLAVRREGKRSGYTTGSNRTFGSDSLVKTLPDGSTIGLPWPGADRSLDFAEYGATSGRVRLGYAASDRWRADLSATGFFGDEVQSPGDLSVDWDGRAVKNVSRRSIDFSVAGALESSTPEIRVYSNLESVEYFNTPDAPRFINYRTPIRTYGVQAQDVLELGAHRLTVGADYTATDSRSEAFSAPGTATAPYGPDSAIRSAALFGQARFSMLRDRLNLVAGARVDHVAFDVRETPHLTGYPANSEEHVVVTPGAGARWSLSGSLQAYGNIGRAFVAPDAFNVAGYSEQRAGVDRSAVFVTRGNANLRPETSWTWDAGLTLRRPEVGIEADLAYFHTNVDDRITTRTDPAAPGSTTARGDTILSTTTYVNADRARIRGIEAQASYDLGTLIGSENAVRLFFNGTRILRADEHDASAGSDRRILNVAELTMVGGLEYDDGRRFSGRLSARYVGDRVDTDYVDWSTPGEIHYPAYLVADLTASLRVTERYRLGAAVRNLADEDYFEVRGFDLPGRSLLISVNASY